MKTEAGEEPERLGVDRARSSVHLDVLVPEEGVGFRALPGGVDDKGTAENFWVVWADTELLSKMVSDKETHRQYQSGSIHGHYVINSVLSSYSASCIWPFPVRIHNQSPQMWAQLYVWTTYRKQASPSAKSRTSVTTRSICSLLRGDKLFPSPSKPFRKPLARSLKHISLPDQESPPKNFGSFRTETGSSCAPCKRRSSTHATHGATVRVTWGDSRYEWRWAITVSWGDTNWFHATLQPAIPNGSPTNLVRHAGLQYLPLTGRETESLREKGRGLPSGPVREQPLDSQHGDPSPGLCWAVFYLIFHCPPSPIHRKSHQTNLSPG